MGIVVDWSDAEIGGLISALGREKARAVLSTLDSVLAESQGSCSFIK